MTPQQLAGPLMITRVVIIAIMAAAVIYACYIAVSNWSSIAV